MKNQALFSSKDKSKKLKCRLLQFLFSALRVKEQADLSLFFLLRLSCQSRKSKNDLQTISA